MKSFLIGCLFTWFASLLFGYAQQPTYLIVHGAWGGAWQFQSVANELQQNGAKVHRVNLTGLGERYHLSHSDINLSVHITDVVNTILFERLDAVVLVGHSYGGMVITGVADRLPERITKLVYLDAFVPENGESVVDLLSPSAGLRLLENQKDGFVEPDWVNDTTGFPRDVRHPLATFEERIVLENQEQRFDISSTYILTFETTMGGKEADAFFPFYQRAENYGWKTLLMNADHNPQVKKFEELGIILLKEQ